MKKMLIVLVVLVGLCACSSGTTPAEIPTLEIDEPPAVVGAEITADSIVEITAEPVDDACFIVELAAETPEETKPVQETAKTETTVDLISNSDEIYLLANVMAGECYQSEWQDMIRVGMTICNRVDSPDPSFPDTLYGVVTQPDQMNYCAGRNIAQIYIDAATEVYNTWQSNKAGAGLPWDYSILFWRAGGGKTNVFRSEY